MDKSIIALVALLVTGTGIVITASVLHVRNSKTEDSIEKVEIAEEDQMLQQQQNHIFLAQQPLPDHKHREKSTFSPKFNHKPSKLSTILAKFPFQECTKQGSTIKLNKLWSVKMEACTGSVGTPLKGVIANWDTPDVSMNYNKQQFELLKSGYFEIKEKGYYEIFLKVTFQATQQDKQYSIIIVDSNDDKIFSIKSQNGTQHEDKYEIISKICGNVAQKLNFHIDVPRASQIFLYPDLTFLTVTKYE